MKLLYLFQDINVTLRVIKNQINYLIYLIKLTVYDLFSTFTHNLNRISLTYTSILNVT